MAHEERYGGVPGASGEAPGTLREGWQEVSFREAMAFYALSDKTLRKRLKDGFLPGRMRPINGREEWVVQIPPGNVEPFPEASQTFPRGSADEPKTLREPSGESTEIPPGGTGTLREPSPEAAPETTGLLALVREQIAVSQEEKEQLRRENQQLVHRVGSLEQALRDRLPAIEATSREVGEQVTALVSQVTAIERRGEGITRRMRVLTILGTVLALLISMVGGMVLSARAGRPDQTSGSRPLAPAPSPSVLSDPFPVKKSPSRRSPDPTADRAARPSPGSLSPRPAPAGLHTARSPAGSSGR